MNKKKVGYLLFGVISSFYRLFPVNKNKAVFYMIHNDHKCGNLKFMYDALMEKRPESTCLFVSKRDLFCKNKIRGLFYFYFVLSFHLMTASEIYLNDNFLPLAYMPIKKRVKVIQFWHGIGAFKRFGLSSETDQVVRKAVIKGNKRLTHLFVSGKPVIPFYEEAFRVSPGIIYPVGLPVLDFYFDMNRKEKAREHFYSQYEELKNKKLLLYTPTFRKTMEENRTVLRIFSVCKLKEKLGEEWGILMRFHPTISDRNLIKQLPDFVYDVSAYEDIKELYEVSDVLINDYSSTAVEFALLKKQILFFAPDLEDYDRGFYRDYEENAPGEIVRDLESLVRAIKIGKVDQNKINHFLTLHYDHFDSDHCKRIINVIYGE